MAKNDEAKALKEIEAKAKAAPLHPSEVRFAEPQPGVTPRTTEVNHFGFTIETY